jgi:hypothetical protein
MQADDIILEHCFADGPKFVAKTTLLVPAFGISCRASAMKSSAPSSSDLAPGLLFLNLHAQKDMHGKYVHTNSLIAVSALFVLRKLRHHHTT